MKSCLVLVMTWHDSPSPISDQAGERKKYQISLSRRSRRRRRFRIKRGAGSTLTSVRPHCVTLLFYFLKN